MSNAAEVSDNQLQGLAPHSSMTAQERVIIPSDQEFCYSSQLRQPIWKPSPKQDKLEGFPYTLGKQQWTRACQYVAESMASSSSSVGPSQMQPVGLIGLSLNNKFFDKASIFQLVRFGLQYYSRLIFWIPTTPHTSNYLASGHTAEHAMKKIRYDAKRYKRHIAEALAFLKPEAVLIETSGQASNQVADALRTHRYVLIRWDEDIASNILYKDRRQDYSALFSSNNSFQRDVLTCVAAIRPIRPANPEVVADTSLAKDYLLDELALFSCITDLAQIPSSNLTFIYHKPWDFAVNFLTKDYYTLSESQRNNQDVFVGFLVLHADQA